MRLKRRLVGFRTISGTGEKMNLMSDFAGIAPGGPGSALGTAGLQRRLGAFEANISNKVYSTSVSNRSQTHRERQSTNH